ncbi:MAG: hypothetical protein LBF61_08160 [Azoarcus sp.]|nr:hypothetical protein [Azoarcus sp.]
MDESPSCDNDADPVIVRQVLVREHLPEFPGHLAPQHDSMAALHKPHRLRRNGGVWDRPFKKTAPLHKKQLPSACGQDENAVRNVRKIFRNAWKTFHDVWKIFRNIRKAFRNVWKIFRNVRKIFRNVRKIFCNVRKVFRNVLKIFRNVRSAMRDARKPLVNQPSDIKEIRKWL